MRAKRSPLSLHVKIDKIIFKYSAKKEKISLAFFGDLWYHNRVETATDMR